MPVGFSQSSHINQSINFILKTGQTHNSIQKLINQWPSKTHTMTIRRENKVRDCNNYLEGGGGWKIRVGGIGEKDNKREGGWM